MDIFSLGCVLAELFSDGQPLFDLSQLLQYRRGEFDPAVCALESLPPALRELVLHMIQLDPRRRLGAAEYLQRWGPRLFPAYFASRLHPFFDSMLDLNSDERVMALDADFEGIRQALTGDQPQPAPAQDGTPASAQRHQDTGRPATPDSAEGSPGGGSGGAGPAASILAGVGALMQDTRALMDRLQERSPAATESSSASNGLTAFPLSTPTASTVGPFQLNEHYISPDSAVAADRPQTGERPEEGHQGLEEAGGGQATTDEGAGGVGSRGGVEAAVDSVPAATGHADGMVLVAALLCTVVRGAKQQELKVRPHVLGCRWCSEINWSQPHTHHCTLHTTTVCQSCFPHLPGHELSPLFAFVASLGSGGGASGGGGSVMQRRHAAAACGAIPHGANPASLQLPRLCC